MPIIAELIPDYLSAVWPIFATCLVLLLALFGFNGRIQENRDKVGACETELNKIKKEIEYDESEGSKKINRQKDEIKELNLRIRHLENKVKSLDRYGLD